MKGQDIRQFLDQKVEQYNRVDFIDSDPICIPHLFKKKQDIEIAGLFASIFAWGQRKTIIQKAQELMKRMDNAPHDFVLNHEESDLKKLLGFKHRTINETDLLYFVYFLNHHYTQYESLEEAFMGSQMNKSRNIEPGLIHFRNQFTSLAHYPERSGKHVSSPLQQSACKRLNMYLRWMVRQDKKGVDFGIWTKIKPHQLICPLDVHVGRVARNLGLLTRKLDDWQAALELTENLKKMDKKDPVKYDFALFGIGVFEKNTDMVL